jgi:PhnB protein
LVCCQEISDGLGGIPQFGKFEEIEMKVNAYLNFGGNCEEALRFYERHLGGKITSVMKWSQMPGAEEHTPPGYKDKILHSRIAIGDTSVMGSDVPGYQPVRSSYLSLSVDSNEEAERIYTALADGGEVYMKMGETFFAHRFGQLRDKFGVLWMVIHERPMPAA